jgi:TatD DNase family protein
MIIDTHCHLNDKQYIDDLDAVLERAKQAGVVATIIPGADPKELPRAIALCEAHEELYFSVGVHPYDIEAYDESLLRKHISHPKCLAVGECGLDYFRLPEEEAQKSENKHLQKEVFISQIKLAIEFDKPLIIHIREASQDSKMILIEQQAKKVGGVLHCYNASPILLDLAKHGFYFGIGGVVTFKNAKKLVDILPQIPQDRLLIETDGPYLTPHPHRGERNEPQQTTLIIKKMADILHISEQKLKNIALDNTKLLFKENFKLI